ncbi:MAG TPA: M15 family metallopeptidase [Mycobacteriales bacterium]|nr:M15 family metallopeptidase [Mycobacteriales bacterium]
MSITALRAVGARARVPVLVAVIGLAVACTPSPRPSGSDGSASPSVGPGSASTAPTAPSATPSLAPLAGRARADVAVWSDSPLTKAEVSALRTLSAGGFATVRVGDVRLGGRGQRTIGVNAATFRPFTPAGTAESTPVWQAVARGDLVVAHSEAKSMSLPLGKAVELQRGGSTRTVRLGALATTGLPGVVSIVNDTVAEQLGLPAQSGAVLGAGSGDPVRLAAAVRKVVGKDARVDLLTQPAPPTAFLTGGRAAREFGAFSYRYHDDGTIEPDAKWVAKNIRYARLPLIGFVQCHRLTIPQLRRALQEIEGAGLSSHITSYSGCYVPRFIESNPERAVSLHTWGIAFDINAPTNRMGTRGNMDPRIVAIFEKWGFRWGGRWSVPDPMHFELAALLDT